jgi:hypothetical protein
MQSPLADLMVFAEVAHHLAAPGEEHAIGCSAPMLEHIQPVFDRAPQ